jgi:hypothetical protein
MYFIQEGEVGIGYYIYNQGLSQKESCKFPVTRKINSTILDYYVTYNQKSEFIYMCLTKIVSQSLSKKFLLENIFVKYPLIAEDIKQNAQKRYIKNVKTVIMKSRK